jgi:hypothetical protein
MRTRCERQLFFDLHQSDDEKWRLGLPRKQPPRRAAVSLGEVGRDWEARRLDELVRVFGEAAVVHDVGVVDGMRGYKDVALGGALDQVARAGELPMVVAQARFEAVPAGGGGSFGEAMGFERLAAQYGVETEIVIPDILIALPPGGGSGRAVEPDGTIVELAEGDGRIPLRVVDIKLSGHPEPSYFAETVYYSMALAGWLRDRGFSGRFVVDQDAAVWPGSLESSALTRLLRSVLPGEPWPTKRAMFDAFFADLVVVPFQMFVPKVRRFFTQEVPRILDTEDWRTLKFSVNGACRGCEYVGREGTDEDGSSIADPNHCMPSAQTTGHLCLVPGLPKSAQEALDKNGVDDVGALSRVDFGGAEGRRILASHPALRASQHLIGERAALLVAGGEARTLDVGASGSLPRWVDLKVYVTAAYDGSNGLTLAFGFATALFVDGRWQRGRHQTFVVDRNDVEAERRELIEFVAAVRAAMTSPEIREMRKALQDASPTYHVYVWDRATHEHLCKVASRHLATLVDRNDAAAMAWLFPPEEMPPDVDAEHVATPVTVVHDVVKNCVVAPLAHAYHLLPLARVYHPDGMPERAAKFSVHPLFEDETSSHIPSERAHEIWNRARGWAQRVVELDETLGKHLAALEAIANRAEGDLRDRLTARATPLPSPKPRAHALNRDSQLWLSFSALNNALERSEVAKIRAMPMSEREARGKAALLEERLRGADEGAALARLGLAPKPGRRVYRLSPGSREVVARKGDMSWAVGPADDHVFLSRSLRRLVKETGLKLEDSEKRWNLLSEACTVTVSGIDRAAGLIAVDSPRIGPTILDKLEEAGICDLGRNVALDPVHLDIFQSKLSNVLLSVGNPRSAVENPHSAGKPQRFDRYATPTALSEVLWGAAGMQKETSRHDPGKLLKWLAENGVGLNHSQQEALRRCLTRRAHLVWGPPGTGKSHTLKAILLAAMQSSLRHQRRRLRVLITSFTWAAVDNVLYDLVDEAARLFGGQVEFHRVRSEATRHLTPEGRADLDCVLSRFKPTDRVRALKAALSPSTPWQDGKANVTVVASTPHQVYNLAKVGVGDDAPSVVDQYDLVVIDEGSQMGVAQAIVALCGLAKDGAVICVGDLLQLPPITGAVVPADMEAAVGSFYRFLRDRHGIEETLLDVNYRSNAAIVDFCRGAGYGPRLSSWSPEMRMRLAAPLPAGRPAYWPDGLAWSSALSDILEPGRPLTCLVHAGSRSTQWDEFEAQTVAALVFLAWMTMAAGPGGERAHDGSAKPVHPEGDGRLPREGRYTPREFWEVGVGIVTPHRAQQARVVALLEGLFRGVEGHDPELIRSAVDTVERFQGQQRDTVFASFAMGDPDAIDQEAAFLYSLNRFNVLVSRARAKLVVVMSREMIDHLPSEVEVIAQSALLKNYAEAACREAVEIDMLWRDPEGGGDLDKRVELRWAPQGAAAAPAARAPAAAAPPAPSGGTPALDAIDDLSSLF